ncbi:dihydrodipicolinate synthase family protein [Conexibacter sp. CPCC 206217]|uniref:dihydrodipicolinate synthase family protein n=1 Tax=Conexibacter sp. CPCC 206217 TaxID=3064574 RepID=UPI002726BD24|nr:dihydrodipicolinate synthase family protein [Conexibacter sp. CPCC 206217]MDO8210321.1 dihydrodipicolinate synthase family protein [Conexibacter sp. CPCC 206217]
MTDSTQDDDRTGGVAAAAPAPSGGATPAAGAAPAGGARVPLPQSGVIVPLVTPLLPDRSVDAASAATLVEHVLSAGVDGVLALGSTGESGALSAADREASVAATVAAVGRRAHVMAGLPAMGTADAVADARRWEALGADSLLLAAPFVFPPSQTELVEHFGAVADAVGIPLVAYDVPGRAHVALSPGLLAQLAADGAIAGVKDSTNVLSNAQGVLAATAQVPGFVRATGSEESIDGLLLSGYDIAVPGLANVLPGLHVALARHARAGEWEQAAARQREIAGLLGLYAAPLAGATPTTAFFAAVKEALRQRGVIEHATLSAPFAQPDEAVAEHVRAWLARVG